MNNKQNKTATIEEIKMLKKLKEMGIDTVEKLDNFIRARIMLRLIAIAKILMK